jgi:DNA-binding NtrC family response regulator
LRAPGENPEVSQAARVKPGVPFKEAKERLVEAFERDYLVSLMDRCGGNVSAAARSAGLDRVYLHRLLSKHKLGSK